MKKGKEGTKDFRYQQLFAMESAGKNATEKSFMKIRYLVGANITIFIAGYFTT